MERQGAGHGQREGSSEGQRRQEGSCEGQGRLRKRAELTAATFDAFNGRQGSQINAPIGPIGRKRG